MVCVCVRVCEFVCLCVHVCGSVNPVVVREEVRESVCASVKVCICMHMLYSSLFLLYAHADPRTHSILAHQNEPESWKGCE
jgi:hypothetical protein